MKREFLEIENYVKQAVENYVAANGTPRGSQDDHVKSIAKSIVFDRDGILPGGSFVQAINANDLESAIGRADAISRENLQTFIFVKRWLQGVDVDCWQNADGTAPSTGKYLKLLESWKKA